MRALLKFLAAAATLRTYTEAAAIPPLSDILTDSQNGEPVTFDMTTVSDSRSVLRKSAFKARSPFTDEEAIGYALVGGQVLRPGSPANALIQGAFPLTEGINHWRFIGLDGPFGCGASDLDRFESGWKLNGLYLTSNGNLAGRGALKVGYAKRIPTRPTIDWYLTVSGSHVDVYININDIPQGHAFSLTFPDPSLIRNLRPLVTFPDDAVNLARVLVYQFAPVTAKAEFTDTYLKRTVVTLRYTKWVLNDNPRVTLLITDGKVTIQVANMISALVDFLPDGHIEIISGPVSTRLLPPKDLQELESKMIEMISSLRAWSLQEGSLHIDSDIGITMWVPLLQSEDPVSENPFVTK